MAPQQATGAAELTCRNYRPRLAACGRSLRQHRGPLGSFTSGNRGGRREMGGQGPEHVLNFPSGESYLSTYCLPCVSLKEPHTRQSGLKTSNFPLSSPLQKCYFMILTELSRDLWHMPVFMMKWSGKGLVWGAQAGDTLSCQCLSPPRISTSPPQKQGPSVCSTAD